jgi:hypothetical protein
MKYQVYKLYALLALLSLSLGMVNKEFIVYDDKEVETLTLSDNGITLNIKEGVEIPSYFEKYCKPSRNKCFILYPVDHYIVYFNKFVQIDSVTIDKNDGLPLTYYLESLDEETVINLEVAWGLKKFNGINPSKLALPTASGNWAFKVYIAPEFLIFNLPEDHNEKVNVQKELNLQQSSDYMDYYEKNIYVKLPNGDEVNTLSLFSEIDNLTSQEMKTLYALKQEVYNTYDQGSTIEEDEISNSIIDFWNTIEERRSLVPLSIEEDELENFITAFQSEDNDPYSRFIVPKSKIIYFGIQLTDKQATMNDKKVYLLTFVCHVDEEDDDEDDNEEDEEDEDDDDEDDDDEEEVDDKEDDDDDEENDEGGVSLEFELALTDSMYQHFEVLRDSLKRERDSREEPLNQRSLSQSKKKMAFRHY